MIIIKIIIIIMKKKERTFLEHSGRTLKSEKELEI